MKKILIVEDEKSLLEAIQLKLEQKNIDSIASRSGKKAYELIKKHRDEIGLIWLDYHLEEMNGLELMQAYHDDDELRQIPVLVVSNTADDDKVKSMIELGAAEYIVKAEARLDETVERAISLMKE